MFGTILAALGIFLCYGVAERAAGDLCKWILGR